MAILVSECALQGDSNKIASGASVGPMWGGGSGGVKRIPEMVLNDGKIVRITLFEDQVLIPRAFLEQFVLVFLVVQSEMSTVVR